MSSEESPSWPCAHTCHAWSCIILGLVEAREGWVHPEGMDSWLQGKAGRERDPKWPPVDGRGGGLSYHSRSLKVHREAFIPHTQAWRCPMQCFFLALRWFIMSKLHSSKYVSLLTHLCLNASPPLSTWSDSACAPACPTCPFQSQICLLEKLLFWSTPDHLLPLKQFYSFHL